MRITRFLDPQGQTHLGAFTGSQPGPTAQLLSGDLFSSPKTSEKTATVARLLAPLTATHIFCIGANYRQHAREAGMAEPTYPVIFMKPATAQIHPGQAIRIPACTHGPEVDYEGELAVVIGKTARDVTRKRALDFVLGYMAANDVSARWWQKTGGGGQFIRGKGFDTFCPLGPVLVTADEIPDPQNLGIKTILNGQVMQDYRTSDMIFSVAELIAFISQDTTLLPGTVILTGTGPGVGMARKPPVFLKPGDEVVIEIERIGRLVNSVT